jgi:hypothetical protein
MLNPYEEPIAPPFSLDRGAIAAFRQAYKDSFGEELKDVDATEMAYRMVHLLLALSNASPWLEPGSKSLCADDESSAAL